jgi:hypothetical protein
MWHHYPVCVSGFLAKVYSSAKNDYGYAHYFKEQSETIETAFFAGTKYTKQLLGSQELRELFDALRDPARRIQ